MNLKIKIEINSLYDFQDIAAEIAEMKIADATTMSNELVKPAEVMAE